MNQITLLAVTHTLSGVCIGGISADNRWVRPVKECGGLTLGDITYRNGEIMQVFDVVAFPVLRPHPEPPHVEDHRADFIRARPQRVTRLTANARADFLDGHAEADAAALLQKPTRSLCLIRAGKLQAEFNLDAYTGKYEARLAVDDGPALPVTDLRWRALGRKLLEPEGGKRSYTNAQLTALLGTEKVYLAYGLSRSFRGTYWPLIIAVHPVPDFPIELDYTRL